MSFADLQSRTNAAVSAKLATDEATLDGVAITGKFDNASLAGLNNMVLGSNPTFTCASSDAPLSKRGKTLVVSGTSHTVREIKPDGTGMSVLELEAQ